MDKDRTYNLQLISNYNYQWYHAFECKFVRQVQNLLLERLAVILETIATIM